MDRNRESFTFDLQLFAINGGANGFPPAILDVIEQVNYLETKIRKGIHAKVVLRPAVSKNLQYFDAKIGETKTFTRSNPIAPQANAANPANNTGLDNGMTPVSRGFEQWQAQLYKWDNGVNLNVLENQTLLGDVYRDDMEELGEAASNSLEVVCVQRAIQAYDSGDSFARASGSSSTSFEVDNINGFLTQYNTTYAPSYGLPQAVSGTNKLAVLILTLTGGAYVVNFAANVTAISSDAPTNNSIMQTGGVAFGQSGTLTLDAAGTWAEGARIVAMDPNNPSTSSFNATYKDGSYVVRPLNSNGNMIGDAWDLAATSTITPSIQIPAAVALLRRRNIPKLPNGLYGCAIDSTILAQFYSDEGFQRATMGSWDRGSVFPNGIVAKGWGVEFVDATQLPVYNAPNNGGFALRHAFCFGEDVISEHPFAGARDATSRPGGIDSMFDIRWVDRIEFITQVPLDREGEVVKMTYKYVGDFEPGTDKGSNPGVVFTSDYCRYKRGVLIQAASPF